MRFQHLVLRLWELPVATFLATAGLAPLAPFAAGATEATVDEAMRALETVEPASRRVELEVALGMLASNVFPGPNWLGRIPTELLMTSTTYQQILVQGERRLLLAQLKARFGVGAARWEPRLPAASEEIIEKAGALVATVRSDDALVAELDALLPR